jgi:hypothetical protein
MRQRRRFFVALGAMGAALAISAVAVPSADAAPSVKVLLDGLTSPKGITMQTDGFDPVVGQGAFFGSGPVLIYTTRHGKGQTIPLTNDQAAVIDIAASPDGTGWAITLDGHVVHQLLDGSIVDVADIPGYQATDPDPVDQDQPPNPTESNPYGLTVAPNGDALVADAAGDDVLRVTPAGVVTTVARFDVELVSTAQVPPEVLEQTGPLPPMITAEPVPTTVTIGPDGAIYVGELMGFPFPTGASHIWRIDADASGAWCSVATPTPGCSVYKSGFTAIQDIAFSKTGELYVLELAKDGVFAFEAGLNTGQFPPAVLLDVKGKHTTELAAGQLSQPGGVAVSRDNKVYVTDGVFSDGRLLRVN